MTPRRLFSARAAALTTVVASFGLVLPAILPSATSAAAAPWTATATVSPTSISRGANVSFKVTVTSDTTKSALVDLEVYSASQGRTFSQVWDNQSFTAGTARTFTSPWTVPAGEAQDAHYVMVGVFTPGWGPMFLWNNAAGSFSVTAASASTTTVAPTTTIAPTTTVAPTTTTVVAPTTTIVPNSTACKFSTSVTVAFCDSFDRATPDPATRSGDLNSTIWGVSRTSTFVNMGQQQFNAWPQATMVGCGASVKVSPPNDVRICNGRVIAAVADNEAQPILAIYPKQPFDIAGGRTGKVVFDVSADSDGPHAAWPEFWWTDQPVPTPHAGELPAQGSYPRNSFGFVIASQCGVNHGSQIGIDQMSATRGDVYSPMNFTGGACVTKGSATGLLNHFEVRISQTRVEVWGTDAGSTTLKLMATAANANLTMTRGLVWVENVHYNAGKFDNQEDHAFAFDNIGFDGPAPYRDLSFDVPDNKANGSNLGWKVTNTPLLVRTVPVYRLQTPTAALVTFNWNPQASVVPSVRLNGGPWHDTAWYGGGTFGWRTMGVSVPVSEVHDGVNTIEFKSTADTVVTNVNAILIAGSPVS